MSLYDVLRGMGRTGAPEALASLSAGLLKAGGGGGPVRNRWADVGAGVAGMAPAIQGARQNEMLGKMRPLQMQLLEAQVAKAQRPQLPPVYAPGSQVGKPGSEGAFQVPFKPVPPSGKQAQITRLSKYMPVEIAEGIADGRLVTSRHPTNGSVQVVDKSSGDVVFKPKNPPPMEADAQPPETVVDPKRDYAKATGPSGFWGNLGNTIGGMVGADPIAPNVEKATQALNNLKVQTMTGLQDAIPGRPSTYLLKELENLTVKPNSLFMSDQRSKDRLLSTRAMLATEVARMDRDILKHPENYTPAQVAKTRANKSALEGLTREYDAILKSFDKKETPKLDTATQKLIDKYKAK